jgi:hypothetical protein
MPILAISFHVPYFHPKNWGHKNIFCPPKHCALICAQILISGMNHKIHIHQTIKLKLENLPFEKVLREFSLFEYKGT